jgi:hypothetical protein
MRSENFPFDESGNYHCGVGFIGIDLVLPICPGLYGKQYDVERHQ